MDGVLFSKHHFLLYAGDLNSKTCANELFQFDHILKGHQTSEYSCVQSKYAYTCETCLKMIYIYFAATKTHHLGWQPRKEHNITTPTAAGSPSHHATSQK